MLPHETRNRRDSCRRGRRGHSARTFHHCGLSRPRYVFRIPLPQFSAVGDVVEIGVPFSDPMADGMTIQRSSHAAIENGASLAWIFEQLDEARDRVAAPLVSDVLRKPVAQLWL